MIEKISNIVAILAGTTHSLLLDSRGQVWSFGQNGFGELGLGTYFPVSYPVMSLVISEVVAIYAGNEHSLFVDVQGQVFGCGQYKQGQLGIKMRPGFFNLITKPTVIGGLIV
jgi:alpha-tubulin suppressor-like RCC1 family protein